MIEAGVRACVVCGDVHNLHRHHRKRRSQGGGDDFVNVIDLCFVCHELVHAHVEQAYEHGLLVKSWQDPKDVAIVLPFRVIPVGNQDREVGTKPCPKCNGKGKVAEEPKLEPAPPRNKVTWSVRVPKDERENGYELLEALMEACVGRMVKLELIRDNNKGANYYTLIAALRKFAVGETE